VIVHRKSMFRAVLTAILLLVPAAATAHAQNIGPDYVASDNIELVDRIKLIGDGVGATLVGDYLFATSSKSLDIFDIKSDPEHPRQIGFDTIDVEWENEEVPTNGKILGMAASTGCANLNPVDMVTGCLDLYDVSNPAAVRYLGSVPGGGDHTMACVFECTWFMGSAGAVVDARNPEAATLAGNWRRSLSDEAFSAGCHHVREIQPGFVLGSCQPMVLMTTRAQDGASPLKPRIIATGSNDDQRFIHSSRWPRKGADRFLLSGGETNASPQCDDTVAAFMVWDATDVLKAGGGFREGGKFKLLDEVRPTSGAYVDGHSPINGLGCSVHWFEEHPKFHNGGAVALAEYENGTRILQITPQGKIEEKDFFLPLAGSTSAPHWNPNGKVIYALDYARGIDVLRYSGPDYVPADGNEPSLGSVCASAAGFKSVRARGAGSGLKVSSSLRSKRSFTAELFQQSRGGAVLKDRRVFKFAGKTKGSITWSGRRLSDGYYYVRFTTKLADGRRDVRRVALRRSHGRFVSAPAFAQKTGCGVFTKYELSSSVFGGRRNVPLRITYQLAHDVDGVTILVSRGKKPFKRFTGSGSAGKTVSFTIPASFAPRGTVVKVRAQVTNGPGRGATLTAKRL
jgi:hypothetical protein